MPLPCHLQNYSTSYLTMDILLYFSLLQEAQDIFGVDFDYEEFKDYGEDESEEEFDEVIYIVEPVKKTVCQ